MTKSVKINIFRMVLALFISLTCVGVVAPAVYAAPVEAVADVEAPENTNADEPDDNTKMMLMLLLGGGLIIIVGVVITVVSTVISTIASVASEGSDE